MKKIKIFLNPIDQIPKWLNNLARKGYRLKSVNNFVYNFEKTNAKFKYFVEFIGHNPNSYNLDYINRLNNSGHKCFRVPLNQMNISYGKIKFRPLARNGAKISTSFDNYNKEFLIIEFKDNEKINSIISNNDIAVSYKQTRNAYIQGAIIIALLIAMFFYKTYTQNNNNWIILLGGILTILLVLMIFLVIKNHIMYNHYLKIVTK